MDIATVLSQLINIIDHKGLTPSELNQLCKKRMTRDSLRQLEKQSKTCCICYEEWNSKNVYTYLPCFHAFHHQCIQTWLSDHNTCPLCKCNVKEMLQPEREESPSQQDSVPTIVINNENFNYLITIIRDSQEFHIERRYHNM